jgi:hypothetical protein
MAMALAVCLTAATLPAAEPSPPSIGARVRALGADGLKIEGILGTHGADDFTITIRNGRDATTIALDRIERLQVVGGRGWMAGFAHGAIIGIGLAVVAGVAATRGCAGGECAFYVLWLGRFTLPLGAIVGTLWAPTRWRDVPLPASANPVSRGLGFQMAPARGGARIALTYGF